MSSLHVVGTHFLNEFTPSCDYRFGPHRLAQPGDVGPNRVV